MLKKLSLFLLATILALSFIGCVTNPEISSNLNSSNSNSSSALNQSSASSNSSQWQSSSNEKDDSSNSSNTDDSGTDSSGNNSDSSSNDSSSSSSESEGGGGEIELPVTSLVTYDLVIAKYKEYVTYKYIYEVNPPRGTEEDVCLDALYEVVDHYDPSITLGYAIKDVNDDQIDELILLAKNSQIYAIFTLVNNIPYPVIVSDGRIGITTDGYVWYSEREENTRSSSHLKKLVGSELIGLEYGYFYGAEPNTDVYYKVENGAFSEITYDEKRLLDKKHDLYSGYVSSNTKKVGLRFYNALLIPEPTGEKVDFSTYDSVIATFTKMFKEADYKFQKYKWTRGDYDDLFTFESDEDYYLYNYLVISAVYFAPSKNQSFGYAKKDLNGDGVQELILLEGGYDILAIFTQNAGKVVLVDSFNNTRTAFIDAKGNIHVKNHVAGVSGKDYEYSVCTIENSAIKYEFTVCGIYEDKTSLEPSTFYKIENGEKIAIEMNEWNQLYAKFALDIGDLSFEEYTQTYANLELTAIAQV